jgi:hypothetical protein
MILFLLILTSILLTVLSVILMAFIVGEKLQVFLVKTLMSDDVIYQLYNLVMFLILFSTYFILTSATYNTFIK